MTRRVPVSREAATYFLREIAHSKFSKDDPRTAQKLLLVASCIEGNHWSRGHKFSIRWRKRIWLRATLIDRRPPGVSVGDALDAQAEALARDMGGAWKGETQDLRDAIADMRKQLRAANRKIEGGSKN